MKHPVESYLSDLDGKAVANSKVERPVLFQPGIAEINKEIGEWRNEIGQAPSRTI